MPPIPKHPSVRARTNRSAGARTLHAVAPADVKVPALPRAAKGRAWREETRRWWTAIWASPMAPEWDESDLHGLFVLAVLVNAFWKEPSGLLASEIRLQRQAFGLSPIDRRRLQWEIERGEEAGERTQKRQEAKKPKAAEAEGPGLEALTA